MWIAVSSLASAAVLRHALVVGANEGGAALDPLRYAELDAQRVADTLTEIGGFDPAHVTVLYAPSSDELREAIHAHADVAKSFDEDLFFFYYSGHADARGVRLNSDLYTFEALRGDIRAMPAEVKVGVLDACRSGTITRLKGAALSQPFLVQDRLAAEGEAWLTSASADEAAQESDKLRGSFFTHYLLSGLRGAADGGGDGEVTLDEAYDYAYARVVDHTGGTEAGAQHPLKDNQLKQQGLLPITRVTEGRATVTLPEELEGDVAVIRMPDRTPVAEVAKKAGRAVTLALPPGTYKFRLSHGKELREAMIGLSDGARLTVSRWGTVNAEMANTKGPAFALDALELARTTTRQSVTWMEDAYSAGDLRHSPIIAGGASVLTPGAGQFYNGQWGKGVVLSLATFSALALSTIGAPDVTGAEFFHGSVTGPNPIRLTAAMLYGIAIADAAYNAQRREEWRPITGVTLSTTALWTTGANDPHRYTVPFVAGFNAEWIPVKGVSVAADRWGWTGVPGVESTWSLGGRMQFSFDGLHLRPGAFVAMGGRLHYFEGDEAEVGLVYGGGANLRWYVTPRYFVEHEVRVESDPSDTGVAVLYGGGVGVHFGRVKER